MWKAFYEHSSLLHFPLFALLFFVAIFTLMVVLAFARSRNGGLDAIARLPFDEPADERREAQASTATDAERDGR